MMNQEKICNPIITIDVTIYEVQSLEGEHAKILMIPFRAEAEGEYFKGHTLVDGVDTQVIKENGEVSISARYMMEGIDFRGEKCRLFIENNGCSMEECKPTIYTDSKSLAFLEQADLRAEVIGTEQGVTVQIFEK